jgi:hypothetical protein
MLLLGEITVVEGESAIYIFIYDLVFGARGRGGRGRDARVRLSEAKNQDTKIEDSSTGPYCHGANIHTASNCSGHSCMQRTYPGRNSYAQVRSSGPFTYTSILTKVYTKVYILHQGLMYLQ